MPKNMTMPSLGGRIETFLSSKNIAVVGASRSEKKLGYAAYMHLKQSGHYAVPVNSNTDDIQGNICYRSLTELKSTVEAVLIIVPPAQALKVVKEAVNMNIKNIWFQPGSESKEAIELCKQNEVNYVDKQCILMYSEPVVSIHKFHRFIKKLTRQYPLQ